MPRTTSLHRRYPLVLGAGVLALIAVAGCSSDKKATSAGGSSSTAAVDPHTMAVTITAADGCTHSQASYAAGGLTVKITNKDATGVTEVELLSGERIVGEKENLPPGFSGTFSVNVGPGDYTLYCPGAATERRSFKVTGTSSAPADDSTHALLVAGTKTYAQYVSTQVDSLVTSVTTLSAAITSNDLVAAQAAYDQARPYYERIEPVAESFTSGSDDLDAAIDARQGDVPDDQWTGFHRIEQGLFQNNSTAGLADYATGLVTNCTKLKTLVAGLSFQPAELANGAVELLDEVAQTKITGEEERYSHIDILDFQANVEGSEQAFANLKDGLTKIDPTLTASVASAFGALDTQLNAYRDPSDPSGFVKFSALTPAQITELTQGLQAVTEPMSRVASKVVNA